jgi:hypothetical protein
MRRQIFVLSIVVTMIAPPSPMAAESGTLRPVTLLASNLADVPQVFMNRAGREVVRLFSQIGVTVIWEEHDPATGARSARASDGMLLRMTIVRDDRRKVTVCSALGAAPFRPSEPRFASVYYSCVERAARRHATDPAVVLGHAAAHEAAHLLIPQYGHSPDGLMKVRWDGRDYTSAAQGQLGFSDKQAALIRAALAR